MHISKTIVAVSIGCVWLVAGCATTQVKPVSEAGSGYAETALESKLLAQADLIEGMLRDKGLVLNDPELQRYLDAVGAKVIPHGVEERVQLRFHVVRDPTVNAFSLPQGGVYLHVGLLTQIESEAQLAFVLAHETSHVNQRHGLEMLHSSRKKTMVAKVTDLVVTPVATFYTLGLGTGLASVAVGLSHAASVNGYGRDQEREADVDALAAMTRAGYDPDAAVSFFDTMNDVSEMGAIEAFFYSNHPANQARKDHLHGLIESGTLQHPDQGFVGHDAYRAATSHLLIDGIELRIADRWFEYAAEDAVQARQRLGEQPELYYWEGEAHRKMAEDPDALARERAMRERKRPDAAMAKTCAAERKTHEDAAATAFDRALALDPSFTRAHRGLGLLAWRRGETERARRHLNAYLAGEGRERDQRYISKLLEEMGP